jgi:hypothetical protein
MLQDLGLDAPLLEHGERFGLCGRHLSALLRVGT